MLRAMGGLQVQQRTSDAYFNATELIRSYNEFVMRKAADNMDSMDVSATVELIENGNYTTHQMVVCKNERTESIENQIIPKYPQMGVFKKSLDKFMKSQQTEDFIDSIAKNEGLNAKDVVKTTRGKNGGTWVHPLLFIDLCMWLDSDFKYQALLFVQDKMLHYRNEACESYKELSRAVAMITPKDNMQDVMARVGKAINFILWNRHEDSERNRHVTESEMS